MTIAVLSGGTATNELVSLFHSLSSQITYILPISDNGGSTSEIIRVIGGPAIGDIRSRLTRLIPPRSEALRRLLSFRLSPDPRRAKQQWNEIVDGSHELWQGVPPSSKEIFRSFFIHVHTELLKRSKTHNANKQFRYELANIGNLFLTGARLFIGSLDSAIELFARLTGISESVQVLPCINTNFPYHISAVLENGLVITGQSQISHPSDAKEYPPLIHKTRPPSPTLGHAGHSGSHATAASAAAAIATEPWEPATVPVWDGQSPAGLNAAALTTSGLHPAPAGPGAGPRDAADHNRSSSFNSTYSSDDEESGSTPQYIHPALKISQLHVSKSENIEPLLSPIERIFYISPYGEEICPTAHSRVTSTLANADSIVFSIGSLMTSVVPVVILRGVGRAILSNPTRKKILLLNGCHDRETNGMDASAFVEVLVKSTLYSTAGSAHHAKSSDQLTVAAAPSTVPWNKVVSHLVYLENSQIPVDRRALEARGIVCVEVKRSGGTSDYYDPEDLEGKLRAIVEA